MIKSNRFKNVMSASLLGVILTFSACAKTPDNGPQVENVQKVSAEFTEAVYNSKGVLDEYPILVGGMAHGREFINAFYDLGPEASHQRLSGRPHHSHVARTLVQLHLFTASRRRKTLL